MLERRKGTLAMVVASVVWGFSGYYFKLLDQASFLEVLSHRIFWSFIIFSLVLIFRQKITRLFTLIVTDIKTAIITLLGCLMISINWVLFIFAVQNGMATEASLGYFIFPLVAAFVGYAFLNERFTLVQWLSISITLIAVGILTIDTGALPWIPLCIALSFCVYGIVKRNLKVDPIVSVTTDVMIVTPLAISFLCYLHLGISNEASTNPPGLFGIAPIYSVLFIVSGLITAGPLILLSYATKRIPYTEVGLISYINPSLQFLVATIVIKEAVSLGMIITFLLIWSALLLYSFEQIRLEKSSRKSVITSSTELTE